MIRSVAKSSRTSHSPREFSYLDVLGQLTRRLGGWNLLYWFAVLLFLANPLFAIASTFVTEKYFTLMAERNADAVGQLLMLSAVFLVVLYAVYIMAAYMKQWVQTALDNQLMLDLANHSLHLPLETAQQHHSGDLFQKITKDSTKMSSVLERTSQMIADIALILLSAFYLLSLYWPLAIAVLIVNPLMLVVGEAFSKRIRQAGKRVAEQEAVVRQWFQDCMQSMELIRVMAVESLFLKQFEERREKLNALQMKLMWLSVTWGALFYLSSIVLAIASSTLCVILVWRGTLDVGQMMAFFLLIWRVFNPMNRLGKSWASVQANLGASARISELLAEPSEAMEQAVSGGKYDQEKKNAAQEHISPQAEKQALVFEQVSFIYKQQEKKEEEVQLSAGSQRQVLDSVSWKLTEGQFIALVGPSGSGKSTAAKIAAGLYMPTLGEVRIAGINPESDPYSARRQIAYVPQSPVLFAGSIRDNITLNRTIPLEQVVQAAKDAQAHQFISELPDGYDTLVKEAGTSLSGGQRQRVALAQAFLSERPIWILDEATSALDPDTEQAVMAAVRAKTSEGRTLIVVAHRLSTIKEADRIYVMDNGKIREQGSHLQLLSEPEGLYRQLWSKLGTTS